MSTNVCLYDELKKSRGIFDVSDGDLSHISDLAKDFAFHSGLASRRKQLPFDSRTFISVCLLPSPFQENWFHFAKSIQRDLNYVLHQVAHSRTFLKECLEKIIKADKFIAELWNIYEITQNEGISQPISLGLPRNDYMLTTDANGAVSGIKQIENNTMSISFSGFTPKATELHRFILDRIGRPDLASKLPENLVTSNVAKSLISAWKAYNVKSAIILIVVEEVVLNICDSRALEFVIFEFDKSVQVRRYPLSSLRKCAKLENKKLFVDGREVAIVYYRTGYMPCHYTEQADWNLRLMMERSMAIKCPTVGYHLAGTKRVQLELTRSGVLERFLPKGSDPDRLRSTFAEFYTFDMGNEGDRAVELAMREYQRFVMKPEREGGGNNLYGERIKSLLESIGRTNARESYILMEKLSPPIVMNAPVKADSPCCFTKMVSELGIFGVILGTKGNIFENYDAGHVMKTKPVAMEEGGITAGFAALDSPYLVQSQCTL